MQLIGIRVFADPKIAKKEKKRSESKPAVAISISTIPEHKEETTVITQKPDLPESSLKIGTFVYAAMRNLEAAGFSFTDDEIDQMCSSEWSKKIFHTNKPFMKRYTPGQTDNKGTDGYVRFKSEPYIFNGNQVLISKEWFESQRKYFTEWYNSI